MGKKLHFEPANEAELSTARRDLARWFADLPPELRAEIEAQAERADGAPAAPADAACARQRRRPTP